VVESERTTPSTVTRMCSHILSHRVTSHFSAGAPQFATWAPSFTSASLRALRGSTSLKCTKATQTTVKLDALTSSQSGKTQTYILAITKSHIPSWRRYHHIFSSQLRLCDRLPVWRYWNTYRNYFSGHVWLITIFRKTLWTNTAVPWPSTIHRRSGRYLQYIPGVHQPS
jgi:hypothetical protein